MTIIDWFNILAGAASIIGLVFSFWINKRTIKIQSDIEIARISEDFNINHDTLMQELRSAGLNAIREDFPNENLLSDFQYKLLEYKKQYASLLSTEELKHINELLNLIKIHNFKHSDFRYLLNEIATKPKIRRS